MSRVSWALRALDSGETYRHVRALCSRSASLMSRTFTSWAIAMTILRTVSACAAAP